MKLTAVNVDKIFNKCLYTEKDDKKDNGKSRIEIMGLRYGARFHTDKLDKAKANIISMLKDLPDDFHKSKGGGMSFLNMCVTKYGKQWGEHFNNDQLMMLGKAINVVTWSSPTFAKVMPGGMPYITVDIKE